MINRSLFFDCITLLQKYVISDIELSRESLVQQNEALGREKERYRAELEGVYINVTAGNKKYEEQIKDILSIRIPELQKVLIEQQKHSIYTQSKKLTIAKITEYRQKIEMLTKSIQENELRLNRSAKILMSVLKEIDTISNEIIGLGECIKVHEFIVENKVDLEMITTEQMEELFRKYTNKGVY